jgi:hypothetical protein
MYGTNIIKRLVYLTAHMFSAQSLSGDKRPSLKLSGSKLYSKCVKLKLIFKCHISPGPCLPIIDNWSLWSIRSQISAPRDKTQKTVGQVCEGESNENYKGCEEKWRPYCVQLLAQVDSIGRGMYSMWKIWDYVEKFAVNFLCTKFLKVLFHLPTYFDAVNFQVFLHLITSLYWGICVWIDSWGIKQPSVGIISSGMWCCVSGHLVSDVSRLRRSGSVGHMKTVKNDWNSKLSRPIFNRVSVPKRTMPQLKTNCV